MGPHRRHVVAVLALFALALMAAVDWWARPRIPADADAYSRLLTLLPDPSPGEPVLVGGRSLPRHLDDMPPALRVAAARLQRESATDASAPGLWRHGLALLVQGDFAAAVADLEAALAQSGSAVVASDLAVAYLGRAAMTTTSLDVVRAVDAAARAAGTNATLAEPRVNLAVALERAGLLEEAARTFRSVMQTAAGTVMTQVAAQSAERLAPELSRGWLQLEARLAGEPDRDTLRRLVFINPQQLRDYLEEHLLPAWAAALDRHDQPIADRFFAAARSVAEAVADVQGDRLWLRAVDAIRTSPNCAESLAKAHRAFAEGKQAYRQRESARLAELFGGAEAAFLTCGSPFAALTRTYRAVDSYFRGDLDGCLRILAQAATDGRRLRSPYLMGRVAWLRGIVFTIRMELPRAQSEYESALETFTRSHEAEGRVMSYAGLAENARHLGQHERGWRQLIASLGSIHQVPVGRRAGPLLDAGAFATQDGLDHAALLLYDANIAEARRAGIPTYEAESRAHRVRVLGRLKRLDAMERELAIANAVAARVGGAMRRRLAAEVAAVEGEAFAYSNPARARAALVQASEFFTPRDFRTRWLTLQLWQARSERASGNRDSAKAHYAAALNVVYDIRRAVGGPAERKAFLDQRRDLIDGLTELQYFDLGDAGAALRASDTGRARTLADALPSAKAADVNRAFGAVAAGARGLYFHQFEQRLVVWVLGGTRLETAVIPLSRIEAERRVTQFQSDLIAQRELSVVRGRAAALHDIVLGPVSHALTHRARLVIFPHGPLSLLPFSALFDARRDSYLVESSAITVAPSLAAFIRPARLAGVAGSMIALGGPTRAPGETGDERALRFAADEAVRVASLYPGGRAYVRESATGTRFLAALRSADVVHVAAHAVGNSRLPDASRLLLAPDAVNRTGDVLPVDLEVGASTARTVVLAGCETAVGEISWSEGPNSLAKALLGTGVAHVVATLWPLADDVSPAMMLAIHGSLRAGAPPAVALREAQLAALHSSDTRMRHPATWGALVVIGRSPEPAGRPVS